MNSPLNYKHSLLFFIISSLLTTLSLHYLIPDSLQEYQLMLFLFFSFIALSLNYLITTRSKSLTFLNGFVLVLAFSIPLIITKLTNNAFSPARLLNELAMPLSILSFIELLYNLILLEQKNTWYKATLAAIPLCIYIVFQFFFIVYYGTTGIIFDDFALIALYQTNIAEAHEYITAFISYPILLLAAFSLMILIVLIYKTFRNLQVAPLAKKTPITALFAVFLLTELTLIFTIIPANFMIRTYKTVQDTISSYHDFYAQRKNSTPYRNNLRATCTSSSPATYVVIIGESETRDNMGVYGYERDTSPWLSKMVKTNPNFLLFTNAYATDRATVNVLANALTEMNAYNKKSLLNSASLIDIANAAGFQTIWLSNQMQYGTYDSPTTTLIEDASKKIWLNRNIGTSTRSTYYDSALLPELKKLGKSQQNRLIFIHLMGCHVNYADRYPSNYNHFSGTSDLGNISEIKNLKRYNQYDNAIYYNDYILHQIFTIATEDLDTAALIYMSDHGEDIKNNRGHNSEIKELNYSLVRIPFFIYYNPTSPNRPTLWNSLKQHSDRIFTNDLLYDTMLGIMQIKTSHYSAEYDLSSHLFSIPPEQLTTTNIHHKIIADPLLTN